MAVIQLSIGCVLAFVAWIFQDINHNPLIPLAGIVFGVMIIAFSLWQKEEEDLISRRVRRTSVIVFWILMLLSAIYAPFFGFLGGMLLSFICALLVYQTRHRVVTWEDLTD